MRWIASKISTVLVLGLLSPAMAGAQGTSTPAAGESAGEVQPIPRSPLELPARITIDALPKEATFDFPAIDRFLSPWIDWKSRMADKNGFRLGTDYQTVSQWSDNSSGEEDSAFGGPAA